MATIEITTISVHPDRAEQLREIRDENDLSSMDSALQELIDNWN